MNICHRDIVVLKDNVAASLVVARQTPFPRGDILAPTETGVWWRPPAVVAGKNFNISLAEDVLMRHPSSGYWLFVVALAMQMRQVMFCQQTPDKKLNKL